MRRPIIAGNWKMNHTQKTGKALIDEVAKHSFPAIDAVICPPTPYLDLAQQTSKGCDLKVGAQNCHPESSGAFTGETSVSMLQDLSCTYCIIGHSERRQLFAETDAFINQKFKALIAHNILPILCVGETLEERESNQAEAVITAQLEGGLKDVTETPFVIAYEPVWAIGTGKVATPDQAQAMHQHIRHWLSTRFSENFAQGIQLQYGGSAKPNNIEELLQQPDIDGALVGGACLKAEDFLALLSAAQQYATA